MRGVLCGVVWCGVVWCVLCFGVWCGVVWCSAAQPSVVYGRDSCLLQPVAVMRGTNPSPTIASTCSLPLTPLIFLKPLKSSAPLYHVRPTTTKSVTPLRFRVQEWTEMAAGRARSDRCPEEIEAAWGSAGHLPRKRELLVGVWFLETTPAHESMDFSSLQVHVH